jgi:hypothetical protein
MRVWQEEQYECFQAHIDKAKFAPKGSPSAKRHHDAD